MPDGDTHYSVIGSSPKLPEISFIESGFALGLYGFIQLLKHKSTHLLELKNMTACFYYVIKF